MISISMWRISLKATAFLLLIVGWFLAAICFGIAWLLRGHKASGNIFYYVCSVCGGPEAGVSAIERCRKTAVLGTENRSYSVGSRRLCGDLDAFDSTVWIVVGTVLLIFESRHGWVRLR